MFTLSSLVGSRPERGLEFTPIGRRVHTDTAFSASPTASARREPSFDLSSHSSDTLHSMSINGVSPGHRTPFPDAVRAPDSDFRAKSLLGSGSSSIQDLQAENKELSGENYNLKVEVATLTKILKQTPAEMHDLANENVHLKQQLLKLSDELQAHSQAKNDSLSAESDHHIRTLQQRIQHMEKERDQRNSEFRTPPEVLQQLEFLKGENQTLIRRLETQKTAFSPGKSGALDAENNQLKAELHKLRRQLSDLPKDAAEQLERAQQQQRLQDQQIDDLREELSTLRTSAGGNSPSAQRLERQLGELKMQTLQADQRNSELSRKNSELSRENSQLNEEVLELKRQNEHTRQEVQRLVQDQGPSTGSWTSEERAKLESALSDLRRAQSQLSQKNRELAELQEDKDAEIARVQTKLASLRRDVQAKDDEQSSMRAQIRTLLSERSSGMSASSAQHYEAQLDQMRQKEERLGREIRSLKDENAALQDELYSINTSKRSEQSSSHQAEVAQLTDKLAFYEKEYDLIQDSMEEVEKQKEQLRVQNARLDDERTQLQMEVESARSKLRRLELQDAQKVNESEMFELEETHRKKHQAEVRRMTAQNEALTLQVSELERKLAHQSLENSDELRRSLARLQMQLSEREASLAEKDRAFERLQKSLQEKDELAAALEDRIRDLNRGPGRGDSIKAEYEYQLRAIELENERVRAENERLKELRAENERIAELKVENERLKDLRAENERLKDLRAENERLRMPQPFREVRNAENGRYDELRHKEELQRVQFEVERLRTEQAENGRNQRELQDQVSYYKTKLDTLMDSESAVQPVIALLESEVDEYRNQNKELHDKLDQLRDKLDAASEARMQREKSQVFAASDEDRKTMVQELQEANQQLRDDKARADKAMDSLEEEFKSVKAEKGRLETRSRNLASELNRTSRHCTRLANRIHEMDTVKAEEGESQRRMAQMQGEVEQLSRSLAQSKIQPKKDDHSARARVEARVLRNESNFFKAKLYDINLKCNDLALMNRFMVSAIKSSDNQMKDDLVKMAQCGIYPDYQAQRKPKLSMKLLATFVLSMVKIKRRAEKARARAHKLSLLRTDIDRDRITLLAEK